MAIYWKPEACRLTVLPDRSGLIGQKLVENVKIERLKWDILGLFKHSEQIFWSQLSISSLKNQVLVIKCFRKKNWDFSKMMERESHLDFILVFGLNLDFSIPIRDVEKMVEGARTSRLWVKSTLGRRRFSSRAKIIWPSAFSLSIIRSGLLGRS